MNTSLTNKHTYILLYIIIVHDCDNDIIKTKSSICKYIIIFIQWYK